MMLLHDLPAADDRVRAARSWSSAQQATLAARVAAAASTWRSRWFSSDAGNENVTDPPVRVVEADDDASARDRAVEWRFEAADFVVPQGPRAALSLALFDRDIGHDVPVVAAPSLAGELLDAAWRDWLQALGADPRGHASYSHREAPGHLWSGALIVSLPWCGGTWSMRMPEHVLASWLGTPRSSATSTRASAPRAKAPVAQALRHAPATARVMLEGTTLSLGQLRALRAGDMVLLDHALDAPARLDAPGGEPWCEGWLGRSGDRVAVELVTHIAKRDRSRGTTPVAPSPARPSPASTSTDASNSNH